MRKLSYNQTVYAYLLAVADVDRNISFRESHIIKSLIKKNIGGISEKAMGEIFVDIKERMSDEEFVEFVTSNLKRYKTKNQMGAYRVVLMYVNITKEHREESKEKAEIIKGKLGFTDSDFSRFSLHD